MPTTAAADPSTLTVPSEAQKGGGFDLQSVDLPAPLSETSMDLF